MRIVCWQTILMKYYTLSLSKTRKDIPNLSSAAVVIGTLRATMGLDCREKILSSGLLYSIFQLQTLTTILKFGKYHTYQIANNKGADQTVQTQAGPHL